MHDPRGVRCSERAGDLTHDAQRVHLRQRTEPVEALLERFAVEHLHHDVGAAIRCDPEVEHLHDARIRDRRGRTRLVEEAVDVGTFRRQHREQDLDRGLPADQRVLGAIDRTHTARPDEADDPVRADAVPVAHAGRVTASVPVRQPLVDPHRSSPPMAV
jgi:hypothetical protein